MRVAITFCDQPKHEGRNAENGYSPFRWSEAESLPHFIEFEPPALFQLAKGFNFNSQIDSCDAAEPERSGNAV